MASLTLAQHARGHWNCLVVHIMLHRRKWFRVQNLDRISTVGSWTLCSSGDMFGGHQNFPVVYRALCRRFLTYQKSSVLGIGIPVLCVQISCALHQHTGCRHVSDLFFDAPLFGGTERIGPCLETLLNPQ
jgi:hypothetical protein